MFSGRSLIYDRKSEGLIIEQVIEPITEQIPWGLTWYSWENFQSRATGSHPLHLTFHEIQVFKEDRHPKPCRNFSWVVPNLLKF